MCTCTSASFVCTPCSKPRIRWSRCISCAVRLATLCLASWSDTPLWLLPCMFRLLLLLERPRSRVTSSPPSSACRACTHVTWYRAFWFGSVRFGLVRVGNVRDETVSRLVGWDCLAFTFPSLPISYFLVSILTGLLVQRLHRPFTRHRPPRHNARCWRNASSSATF